LTVNKKHIITGAVGVVLAGTSVAGLIGWQAERRHVQDLEAQVAQLQRQEKRSAIDRSVSAQMEEIAFEQKIISDEQRENAILQTRVANEMRERSEIERQNALAAEQNALASEKKAIEASALAESQRKLAEHQRIQAEIAQLETDTLRFIALGRSLGSLSTLQFLYGNTELAALMSCASYSFTNRYKGDIYNPAVFQALSLSSQGKNEWTVHNGALMNVSFLPKSDSQMITVSTYGEILQHEKTGNRLNTTVLFKDSKYDFRDLYISDKGDIYAVSRTGHLYCKTSGGEQILELTGNIHPTALINMTNGTAIIGENQITWVDLQKNKIVSTQKLPFRVTCIGIHKHLPLLFDDKGMMHLVKSADDITTEKVPVSGNVSAYAYSNNTGYEVYGINDGSVYFFDKSKKVRQLIGHRSRISKVRINGRRIYTASYDGTVNLWIADSEKPEPMSLYLGNNWIMHFSFDKSKNYLWIGDQWGHLSEVLISINEMADRVHKQLKREFTPEEWNFYIGKKVPFEKFMK